MDPIRRTPSQETTVPPSANEPGGDALGTNGAARAAPSAPGAATSPAAPAVASPLDLRAAAATPDRRNDSLGAAFARLRSTAAVDGASPRPVDVRVPPNLLPPSYAPAANAPIMPRGGGPPPATAKSPDLVSRLVDGAPGLKNLPAPLRDAAKAIVRGLEREGIDRAVARLRADDETKKVLREGLRGVAATLEGRRASMPAPSPLPPSGAPPMPKSPGEFLFTTTVAKW
jgi:hypothetical protein